MFRLIFAVLVLLACSSARADSLAEARAHYERGLAAYALEHYDEAADEYEKAFALKPDSALLYNAAQAHRLAGHYERALRLYQSYLRIFGDKVNNQLEVQRHIAELQKTIDAQQKAQKSPPTGVRPPEAATPPPATTAEHAPPPPTATPTTPPATTAPAPPTAQSETRTDLVQTAPPRERPVYKKAWFWAVIGGAAVAVGVGVGLGVALTPAKNPTPSYGATTVQ